MAKSLSMPFFLFWLLPGLAFAQNLSGTYALFSQGTTLTLTLEQDNQGNIKGTLFSTTGAQYRVEGMIQNNVGVGTCISNQGGSYFEAHPKGNELLFALIEPGANNMPDYSKVRQLVFTRKEGTTLGSAGGTGISRAKRWPIPVNVAWLRQSTDAAAGRQFITVFRAQASLTAAGPKDR